MKQMTRAEAREAIRKAPLVCVHQNNGRGFSLSGHHKPHAYASLTYEPVDYIRVDKDGTVDIFESADHMKAVLG